MNAKVTVARIREIKALQLKKNRTESGMYVAEGEKVVREAVEAGIEVSEVFGTERPDWLPQHMRFTSGSSKDLERMSGLKTPPKFLAEIRQSRPAWPTTLSGPVLMLDGIRDPGNFGTLLRTADWFGFRLIIASPDCVDSFNPKVVQSAMGSLFRAVVLRDELRESGDRLLAHGYRIYAAVLDGTDALQTDFSPDAAFIIGSESHGIQSAVSGEPVSIPAFGDAESLNAGIAGGILMARYRQQHRKD